ncbi:MAG: HlyD family efflux transporter periplasmic adaptor subunit [Muribaculaceae bacterium]|nr:HlyD family efflux transporter periplasmic adaptor subunit [Muribaculaceae bacterium]
MKKITLLASMVLVLMACNNKENEYDATGTFEVTEVTVSAKTAGELISFTIQEGEELTANAVVGQIDDTQLKLKKEQLESTKSQLDANRRQLGANRNATSSKQLDLEKQVAGLRQQITNAKREKQRFTELLRDGAVPKKQVDDISYQISVLEKQLAATQDQIRSNNASLAQQSAGIDAQIEGINAQSAGIDVQQAQLDDQIANTSIKSPIAGSVLEKYVEQGEFVTVGKPLFKVADTRKVVLRAYVTSAQLEHIKVGQQVKVMTDYGKQHGSTYSGVITWISPRSEFTPKTIVTDDERADLVYAVKITVDGNSDIKMGMYGKVKF